MPAAGYSGKPLADKLSLRDGQRAWWENMPDEVRAAIEESGRRLVLLDEPEAPIDAAHLFVRSRADLERGLARLDPLLAPDGMLWISWPKRASGIAGDVGENEVRAAALPLGLVDVKVCAVDAVWSGLKLVRRRHLR
jgi:hypothetical protein